MRDYGLARTISTPGDTHGLTHEKSEAAGAAHLDRVIRMESAHRKEDRWASCAGGGRVGSTSPFLLMVSRLESPDVMLPYLLGSVLSRSASYIRVCGALGALSSEVPATAGVSTVDPPGSGFELGQKTRPRCRECPSSPTRPLYVRPQSQGPKFWMEAPPNSGGLSGGPAYGGRTFLLGRVSDWGLR